MTLAIARKKGSRIALVADTLITEHDMPLPHKGGVIKLCMLRSDLCVAFSNSPESADRDFEKFHRDVALEAGFSECVSFFETSSAVTGNDYILAFGKVPAIVKIADGKRIKSLADTVWIGDKFGFERFREYEARSRPFPQDGRALNAATFMDELENSPASDLYSTMRNVILDDEVVSVGGFACVVSNRDGGFRHSVYSDMLYNPTPTPDVPFQFVDAIDFGASEENAGFSVSQFSTGYLGLNLVAYYFAKGKTLYLFYGEQNRAPQRCIVVAGLEASQIQRKLNEIFRVDLNWLVAVSNAGPAQRETVFRKWTGLTAPAGPQGAQFSISMLANTFSNGR